MAEKIEKRVCPDCGAPLDIKGKHIYYITQDDEGKWHKSVGDVFYSCIHCDSVLYLEIRDILPQVDEL